MRSGLGLRSPRISWVLCSRALRRERLTEEDLLTAARQQGFTSLEEVGAVVLEPSGKLSVLKSSSVRLD